MEISNLTGLEKPLTAVVKAIQSATGVLYTPTRIKKEAAANAEATVIKTQNDLYLKELEARALGRIKEREMRRQQNIDSVIEIAESESTKSGKSEGKLDERWVSAFFDGCQDVSDKELQELWGRLLAGELEKEGSFSLRTLQCIKSMSKKEADQFSLMVRFLWDTLYIRN